MFEALEFRAWSSLTLLVNSSVTAGPISMPKFSIARVLINASNAIQMGVDSSPKQHVLKLQEFGVLGLGGIGDGDLLKILVRHPASLACSRILDWIVLR